MYWTKPCSSSSGFGHLCRSVTARDACARPRGSGSSAITSTPRAASDRATARPVMWQLKTRARAVLDAVKGAIDVRGDVGQVLDPDRHAQKTVRDAEALALLGREAPGRRDRRVAAVGAAIPERAGAG